MTPLESWTDRARHVPIEDELARRGFDLKGRTERKGPCPVCGGTDRFSINTAKRVWNCRGCSKGGDVIDLVQHLDGIGFVEACTTLTNEPPPNSNGKGHSTQQLPQRWIYRDKDGNNYLRVLRFDDGKKSYPQSRWDGRQWLSGKPAGPKIPYRLPELIVASADAPVFICEGEKCADSVAAAGFVATTNSEGAGKWTPELNEWFKGRTVYILPDNDEPGRDHAQAVAAALNGTARNVRVVELPGLAQGEDVYDWLSRGNLAENLIALGEAAPVWRDGTAEERPRKFRLRSFAEIKSDPKEITHLIRGLIPSSGITVVWGKPKTKKTFKVFDAMMHVARGIDYRDLKTKQAPVVYITLEGQKGFERRVDAYRKHHGISEEVPFYLITVSLDLIAEHEQLIDDIKAALGKIIPGAIVIDTLNRSLRGSESRDEDMGAYLSAAEEVSRAFNQCAIIIVHHCGVDGTRPRGHTSLGGTVECQIEVKDEGGLIFATVELAKDMETGLQIVSRLEPVDLEPDAEGLERSSCVLIEAKAPASASKEQQLTPNQLTMYRILFDAGLDGLSTLQWNDQAKKIELVRGARAAATCYDLRNKLKDKGMVREFGGRWYINHGSE